MKISLRERRKLAGKTQGEIGAVLGISAAQYSRVERDPTRIKSDRLQLLADFYRITVDELLDNGDAGSDGATPLVSMRRTLPVFSQAQSEWREDVLAKVGEIAPTKDVSIEAYAIQIERDDMVANDWRSLPEGSWLVIDPKIKPNPGNIVHAIDEATDDNVVRIYQPLHPSNPRAPGFLLKAADPAIDDIYVSAEDADRVLLGTAIEARVILRK